MVDQAGMQKPIFTLPNNIIGKLSGKLYQDRNRLRLATTYLFYFKNHMYKGFVH